MTHPIIVIDDSLTVCMVLELALTRAGVSVATSATRQAGRE
jgi:hypothetical protein